MRSLAVILLVLATACAKKLEDLAPFPCAKDQSCPGALACAPGVGCVAARVDALCGPSTDCARAGAACGMGVCAPPCKDGAGCGARRACSASTGTGVCLADCSSDATCPAGLVCKELWYAAKRGCMPGNVPHPACASLEVTGQCKFCGSAYWGVSCGSTKCPDNSSCAGGGCKCNPGYTAVTCAGELCQGLSCTYPNYWCYPNFQAEPVPGPVSLEFACTAEEAPAGGVCHCSDGRAISYGCFTTESCEDRCATGCDTFAQDCSDPARPKCTVVANDAGVAVTGCLAETGQLGAGAECHRTSSAVEGIGHDDCAKGLYCTNDGAPAGGMACRSFCRTDAHCAQQPGHRCAAVHLFFNPNNGYCLPACEIRSATCGDGRTCAPVIHNDRIYSMGYCRDAGDGATGSACGDDADCGSDMVCLDSTRCALLCDPSHSCPDGAGCLAFRYPLTGGGGYCP